jgi:excisionase family DNA binding protein
MATVGEFLQLDEVADIARVSVSTVRHWIKAGRLPSLRPGRRRLVRREDFERFLITGRQPRTVSNAER